LFDLFFYLPGKQPQNGCLARTRLLDLIVVARDLTKACSVQTKKSERTTSVEPVTLICASCLWRVFVVYNIAAKFDSGIVSVVTKVAVTRCGNWWCHPIFSSKSDYFFSRYHSHPLRLPSDCLSSNLCKFSRKLI